MTALDEVENLEASFPYFQERMLPVINKVLQNVSSESTSNLQNLVVIANNMEWTLCRAIAKDSRDVIEIPKDIMSMYTRTMSPDNLIATSDRFLSSRQSNESKEEDNIWGLFGKSDEKKSFQEELEFPNSFIEIVNASEPDSSSTAEYLIYEENIFDIKSRYYGDVVTRDGAGLFQEEVLKGIFSVTEVKAVQGAYVLEGNILTKKKESFLEEISNRLKNSSLDSSVDYLLLANEKFPSFDEGLPQVAWKMMMGASPAILVYPKSWNMTCKTSAEDSFRSNWRNFVSSGALLSSSIFASNAFDTTASQDTSWLQLVPFATMLDISYLYFGSLAIAYVSYLVESNVAKIKGVNINGMLLPSLIIMNYGLKTSWLSLPKSRNDMFDITLSGIITSLTLSTIALYAGISLTLQSNVEAVKSFPTISISLLQSNTMVNEILSSSFKNMPDNIVTTDATIHLHWLAIVGATSFMASILQIFPAGNNAGSKLSMTFLSLENYSIFNFFFGLFRGLFLLLSFFTLNDIPTNVFTKSRLLLDFFVCSIIAGNDSVSSFYSNG